MIKRIFTAEELEKALESVSPDIFRGKIKALARAYGFSYDFLRFFAGESAVVGIYYGSAVICGDVTEEEIGLCLTVGAGEILMPDNDIDFGEIPTERLYVMEYVGGAEEIASLSADTPYGQVYEILREGFDISFDDWYTDTCHNVRHGISEVFTLENKAAAQKMFTEDGVTLISMVAVRKNARGTGLGGRLIKAVSGRFSEKSRVFVICEGALVPFYEKNEYIIKKQCIKLDIKKGS